jgi:hypothetical protein
MTDKKEGAPKDASRPGETPVPKRPHATLDLKATEIKPPAPAKSPAEASPPKPATAPPPAAATPPGAAKASSAAATDKTAATKAPEAKAQAKPAEGAKAGPPTQGSKPGARPAQAASTTAKFGGLATHLLAGLAGGLLVLVATNWIAPNGGVTNEAAVLEERTSAVESRLGALEQAKSKDDGIDVAQKLRNADSRIAKLEESNQKVEALRDAQGKLESDTKALAAKLAEQSAGPADRDRIGKLEERLATLAAAADAEPDGGRIPQLAAITSKITDIETTVSNQLEALRKSMPQDIEGRVAQVAEASEAAKAASQRLDRELAGVRTDAARLSQRLEALKADGERSAATLRALQDENGRLASALNDLKGSLDTRLGTVAHPADIAAAVDPVAGKLTALEQNLDSVVKTEQDRKANAERVLLSLELANLKRVVERGQSYAAELSELRKASGGRIDLTSLDRYKDAGVPTQADLEREFRPVMYAVIDAETEPRDGSIVNRLLASAKSVVRVRKVEHSADDKSAEAVVARMDAALKEGRLGDVIAEAKSIPPQASAPVQEWLTKVEARHAVDHAIASIEGQLKASLSGPPPASDGEPGAPAAPAGKG